MARLHLALLLLLVTVTVSAMMVSAADKPPSVTTAEAPGTNDGDVGVAEGPTADDNAIGTTGDDPDGTPGDGDDDDVAVAGPVGSNDSYAKYPPPQQASSGSVVGVGFASVIAGSLFFF